MVNTSMIYKSRIDEMYNNIERDFQAEWHNKKCKWFFKKCRQNKLRVKIFRRYESEICMAVSDFIDLLFQDKQKENE